MLAAIRVDKRESKGEQRARSGKTGQRQARTTILWRNEKGLASDDLATRERRWEQSWD